MKLKDQQRVSITMLPGSVSRLAGGIYTSVRRLSESLRNTSEADVMVIGHQDIFTEKDLIEWQPPQPELLKSSNSLGRARELARKLNEVEPDIVHYHFLWSYASLAARFWKSRHNQSRKLVISTRGMLDSWALNNSKWKKLVMGRLLEFGNLDSAACIHALSENEAIAIRNYGSKAPICIIPNGVDIANSGSKIRTPNEPRALLFIGRIHSKKGLSQLIEAWSASGDVMRGWKLIIAGWDDGGHEAHLRRRVSELSLESQVDFVGPKMGDAKSKLFSDVDAVVLPSLSEGLPMAVLEAWSNGLPVLMTDACNLAIGFSSGAAIRMEPTRNSITAALKVLASMQPLECHSMGLNGRALVQQNFTWDEAAIKMLDVYRWILGTGDRPECIWTNDAV